MKSLLGVSGASYLQPLLYGLEGPDSPFELVLSLPGETAIKLRQRVGNLRCAFLSPIDYARHGGDYRIVPDVCISSSTGTDTIQLFINPEVHNITSLAVDVGVTSEIILAKIILLEKFPNLFSAKASPQIVPMVPNIGEMLKKADAALVVNLHPHLVAAKEPFALDLVDEWYDLTGLPYIHGFWVGHEDQEGADVFSELKRAKEEGTKHLLEVGEKLARQHGLSVEHAARYLSSFSYSFGHSEEEGLSEFIRYAYYHGVLPDVPEINFFGIDRAQNSGDAPTAPQ